MPRKVLIIQHMADDGPARFARLFAADGFATQTAHPYAGEPFPDPAAFDVMLVLGGAMDVWQEDEHPWLTQEKRIIRDWVGNGRPYIGICLGHQLLAEAMGGEVVRAAEPEIGVHEVEIDGGDHPFFLGLAGRHPALQWHHAEVSRPPAGATVLAASPRADVQALAVAEHALGVQFHFEWTMETIRNWPASWIAELERQLGHGAHSRLMDKAEPLMPELGTLTEAIYVNFKRASGL